MKENGFTLKKRPDADDTPHKLLRVQTAQMTYRFWQIYQPKPNPCSIVWSRQQVALAFMSMQTKRSTHALIKKQEISTLNGGSLKLLDEYIYPGSSISSTEIEINMRQAKAWTAVDRLSIIWKSDLSDKINRNFFQAAVVSYGR